LHKRNPYKEFLYFDDKRKAKLIDSLSIELPALRGKLGASQEEVASAIGVSRQTYSAIETRSKAMQWSIYMALMLYFDYIPSTHYMLRDLDVFPNELDECWLSGKTTQAESREKSDE